LKYSSIIYNNKKVKNPLRSFLCYLRDCIVYYLPIKRLPGFIRKLLYGDISYVFFIHPRRSEDYYLGLPFLSIFRKFLPKRTFISLASILPPVIVSNINNRKANGVVMSSLILPEVLINNRKNSINAAVKAIKFAKRITKKICIVGLGAWWPIISKRGLELKKHINDDEIIITNGHTGTLLSIYKMLDKISLISDINMTDLKICVIGAGKMGTNVTKVLYGKVDTISLIDIHKKNIDLLIDTLKTNSKAVQTKINSYVINNNVSLLNIFNRHHMAICVTSNLKIIIKANDIPDYFIIIDDSRPEAVSRCICDPNKIILEGGLMKIMNSTTNYDYGFGIDDNVFGCLAETYALAIDDSDVLSPTLGDVDSAQFEKAKYYYNVNGINVGDFKTGDKIIDHDKISNILKHRDIIIKNEGSENA